jgi:hypothetical protein
VVAARAALLAHCHHPADETDEHAISDAPSHNRAYVLDPASLQQQWANCRPVYQSAVAQ